MKKIIRKLYGSSQLNRIFHKIFTVSLGGLNYANVRIEENGEKFFLKYLDEKHQSIFIFDVGANNGQYLKTSIEVLGDKLNIHSFEPSSHAFKVLSSKFKDLPKVTLNNFGLAEQEKKLELHTYKLGDSGASIYMKDLPNFEYNHSSVEECHFYQLDNYLKDITILEQVKFLKIDVEGAELDVLNGAKQALGEGFFDYIQFEFGENNIASKTYFKDFFYLLEEKYDLFMLLKDGLRPIKDYSLLLEIFLTANYIAIRK